MKRIFLFAILIILAIGSYMFKQSVFAQSDPIDDATKQHILNATVQIKLIAPQLDQFGNQILTESNGEWHVVNEMGHGLGTVVTVEGQPFIVTHDHWGALLGTAVTVRIQDASGRLLLEISGDHFRSQIVYADQGTMVLMMPESISVADTALSNLGSAPLSVGSEVYLTRHQAGQHHVELVAATVKSVIYNNGPLNYQLETADGTAVVRGDSGGGVWANNTYIGNLWQNIQIQTFTQNPDQDNYTKQELTPYSIAAAFPNVAPYLSNGDDNPEKLSLPEKAVP